MLRTGFSNRNFCVPFAQFETRWVFDVNGKQPMFPGLSTFKKYGTKVRMNQCFDNHISSSDYISIFKQIAATIILIQFHGLGS